MILERLGPLELHHSQIQRHGDDPGLLDKRLALLGDPSVGLDGFFDILINHPLLLVLAGRVIAPVKGRVSLIVPQTMERRLLDGVIGGREGFLGGVEPRQSRLAVRREQWIGLVILPAGGQVLAENPRPFRVAELLAKRHEQRDGPLGVLLGFESCRQADRHRHVARPGCVQRFE